MNRKAKDLWLRALESGQYRKARGIYKRQDGSHCCLGVLAACHDIPEDELWREGVDLFLDTFGMDEETLNELVKLNDTKAGYPIQYIKDNI